MNPQVEAAIIAAIATLVGVGGTVLVALRGFRATKQATDATIKAQPATADAVSILLSTGGAKGCSKIGGDSFSPR